MPDGLRINDSAIARAATEQQSLLAWLQDPKGQGQGSGRTRIFCEDAIDSITLSISLYYLSRVKMVIGGRRYMADCWSDFHAMSSTCSNMVEAPQTLDSAELNERFKQSLQEEFQHLELNFEFS